MILSHMTQHFLWKNQKQNILVITFLSASSFKLQSSIMF